MKKLFSCIAFTLLALVFSACSKDDNKSPGETTEIYIDATSKNTWHYYSFAQNKVVGSADESAGNNAAWGSRNDWDIAIQRYNIRTNSGAFSAINAQGGVYTFDKNISFDAIAEMPENIDFKTDKAFTSEGMGGITTVIRSDATVILFKTNDDGSIIMPPVYLQAPVYIFRSADGANYYKVQFTQYKNENDITGHILFKRAQIYKN